MAVGVAEDVQTEIEGFGRVMKAHPRIEILRGRIDVDWSARRNKR